MGFALLLKKTSAAGELAALVARRDHTPKALKRQVPAGVLVTPQTPVRRVVPCRRLNSDLILNAT
jgi:hypothetical protein